MSEQAMTQNNITPPSLPVLVPNRAEYRWAAGVHLGVMLAAFLTTWIAGMAGMAVAAVVIATRPLNSQFVVEHAKEAFNFNLSIFIYATLALVFGVLFSTVTLGLGLLLVVPLGVALALATAIVWLVCSIKAAMRAIDGEEYRYPLTIRFWQ